MGFWVVKISLDDVGLIMKFGKGRECWGKIKKSN